VWGNAALPHRQVGPNPVGSIRAPSLFSTAWAAVRLKDGRATADTAAVTEEGTDSLDPHELLRRTLGFLERCSRAPREALEGEDPAVLLQCWQDLMKDHELDVADEKARPATEDKPPIQLRHRRSA
jgi:hypothetical protein